MSVFEIKMPKLGESITEGTIVTWSVKVGDIIKEDDILFEVTTAKVNAEVPSPVEGKLLEILFKEGETAEVGAVVARIQLEAEEGDVAVEASEPEPVAAQAAAVVETPVQSEVAPKVAPKVEHSRWYSPVVLRIAKESSVEEKELNALTGTGYLGRLSKNDLLHYLANKKSGVASPSPKKLIPSQSSAPVFTPESTDVGANSAVDMDPVARIIAERMVQSKKISAHVTTVVEVDVTKLVNWRKRVKDTFQKQEGIALTFMPAIVEATAKALKAFPKVNASVVGNQFILKKQINIGIAVSLDDGNLIVPVIHNADKLSMSGIALSIDSLATKARSNKLKLEEIEGGTFTISNFGSFKNLIGTPIINQPEVAILGVGYVEKKPAVIETPEGDVIAIRHKMYLSLTYDHRIINGAVGGAFVKEIADNLENWNAL